MKTRMLHLGLDILLLISLLSMAVSAAASTVTFQDRVYTTDESGILAYAYVGNDTEVNGRTTGYGFDLIGAFGGSWKQSTYIHPADQPAYERGYYTFLKSGTETAQIVTRSAAEGGDTQLGVNVGVDFAFQNNGKLLQVIYTLKNTTAAPITCSLGTGGDVQIGADDTAAVQVFSGDSGFLLASRQDADTDADGNYAQWNYFFGAYTGVTPVSDFWYGTFSNWDLSGGNRGNAVFYGTADREADCTNGKTDSIVSWHWDDITLQPNETAVRSIMVGIGGPGSEAEAITSTPPTSVTINTEAQTFPWDGSPKSFAIKGTTLTGFEVEYYVNSAWTSTAPSAVGTYSVKITRAADATYAAYAAEIPDGLVIQAIAPTAPQPTGYSGLVYDGTPQPLIAEEPSAHGVWQYSLDGSPYSPQIPTGTDAGTYTVNCQFVPHAGYSDLSLVTNTVTISPLPVDEPTDTGSLIYNGTSQTPSLNGADSAYLADPSGDTSAVNAGTYALTYTLDSNHIWKTGSDGIVPWTIGKAAPVITDPVGIAYVNDSSVTLQGGTAKGVTGDTLPGRHSLSHVDLTSAGEKTASLTFLPEDETNYHAVSKTDFIVSVTKRTVASAEQLDAVENAIYGTAQEALGLPAAVSVQTADGKTFSNIPVVWTGYDATVLTPQTLTGTLELAAISAEADNPLGITAAIVVDLQEKNAAAFDFLPKRATYNGAPICHEIAGTFDGVASTAYTYAGTGQTVYPCSAEAPADAGTYTVTAAFTMEEGYAAVEDRTTTLTIAPRTLTVTAESHTMSAGSPLPILRYRADGLVAQDTFLTAPTCTTTADTEVPGTYDILPSGADAGSNYSIVYVPGTLTVERLNYTIVVDDAISHGDIQVNTTTAAAGAVVTIHTAPDDGYALHTLTVIDAQGNPVKLTETGDAVYTFIMPEHSVTVDAVFAEIIPSHPQDPPCPADPYTDLDPEAWYYDSVSYCIENDLMQGVGNDLFWPNTTTNRAMIVTILWRMEGEPMVEAPMTFADVPAERWYTDAIRWALHAGIVTGYSDTVFGPERSITREQMTTLLWRYCQYVGIDVSVGDETKLLSYADTAAVSSWARSAMQWACSTDMIKGIEADGKRYLSPQGDAVRCQSAALIHRFCKTILK